MKHIECHRLLVCHSFVQIKRLALGSSNQVLNTSCCTLFDGITSNKDLAVFPSLNMYSQKVSEIDQEILQSHTADQPTAP